MISTPFRPSFADENGGSKRDYPKAYDCFKKLAATENKYQMFAINMIGHMFYNGVIPRRGQSYEESLKRHLTAAKSLGSAARHAAYMLSIGSGCEFDYDRTVQFYEEIIRDSAASEDNTKSVDNSAIYNLARFYCDYGEFAKAAGLYKRLSQSMPDAAIQLGKLYKLGVLTSPPRPDYVRAAHYFQQAIRSGKCGVEAYYELGKLYFNPTGDFDKDFAIAQENFQIAADMGHSDSQYMLAYMYEAGHLEKNIAKAIHYHELAAEQGHMMSAAALATLYQQPGYVNYNRAVKYAKMAASSGMGMGEFLYANLLFFGRGCETDMDKAYEYYDFAARHGFVQAEIMKKKIDAILDSDAEF